MLLILMVVFIHSGYKEGGSYPLVNYFQNLFSGYALCRVANPLFFMMSGFLFYYNVKSLRDVYPKIKKRVRSLLIPYIIWNIVFVLWYVILSYIPQVSNSINSDVFDHFTSIWSGMYYLFIQPANFPLWFLRNLIVFVAVSPLIWYVISRAKWYSIIIFFILAEITHFGGLLWFSVGASVAILSSLEEVQRLINNKITIGCIIFYLVDSLWRAQFRDLTRVHTNYIYGLLCGICSFIAVWRGYDLIARGRILTDNKFIEKIVGYSFFIYVFHEPTYNIIKKIPILIFGQSELVLFIFFLINPFILCGIAILLANFLQRFLPKLYNMLVGGRSTKSALFPQ